MTAGFYAPLPPARSGVADYAATLLGALPGPVRVGADGDVNLYHLGNNGLHREIHRRALERPGVAVLHDAVLQHFYLGSLDRDRYIGEFVHNYGGWYRGLAEELWAERSRSASCARYFRWPMLRRVAEMSTAVIVHNAAAAAMVLREAPAARVETIPHLPLAVPAVDPVNVERWRSAHGIAPSHTLFGVAGFLRPAKRVMTVLRTFARLRALRPDVHLLLAGSAESDLERAMAPFLGLPGIVRDGHLPESRFQTRLTACDVGINLRYPPAGESSGITTRWLGIGRPVLVSEGLENAAMPLSICPRVPVGVAEEEGLAATMLWLADSASRRHTAGMAARAWVESELDLRAIANRYWRVLEECRS